MVAAGIVYAVFVAISLMQAILAFRFVRALRCPPAQPVPDQQLPPVLVVLCLRGTDEMLDRTLLGLVRQDYPQFHLRVVLDSSDDPALEIVERIAASHGQGRVEVRSLRERAEFCSSKNAGLLLGTADVPERYKIVVTVDGDAVLHSSCLRELVEPIVRGRVAIASGNRWYAPPTINLGSLTRKLWNVYAIPIMHVLEIAWGGCCAIRADLMQQEELRRRLARTLNDDQTITAFALERNEKVEFVPEATIINRERCSLSSFYNFVVRQFLCVRLYHPRWWFCSLNCTVFTGIGFLAVPVLCLFPEVRTAAAAGGALFAAVVIAEYIGESRAVRAILKRRGEKLERWRLTRPLWWPITIATLVVVSFCSIVQVWFSRSHRWRGILYQLGGDPPVRVLEVAPMPPLKSRHIAETGSSVPG